MKKVFIFQILSSYICIGAMIKKMELYTKFSMITSHNTKQSILGDMLLAVENSLTLLNKRLNFCIHFKFL